MKKSIFKDWSIAYWVDYSDRKDCEEVIEISQEQFLLETQKPVEVQEVVQLTEEEQAKIDEDVIKQEEEIKLQEIEK